MRTRTKIFRNRLGGFLTFLIGAMLLTVTSTAFARSTYLTEWEFYYPDSRSDNNAQCALCHLLYDDSGGYNDYGNAIRLQSQTLPLTTRFANVEPLNSDGDPGGYTNLEEINLDTQPGWTVGDAVPSGVTGLLDPGTPGALQFSSATYSVNENGGSATITVTRVNGSDGTVTVDYATSNGTATAGSDYTATSGTLTLADGVTSASFSVPITNDTLDEPNETVNLALSNPTGGATLGSPTAAVLTILDDDEPVLLPGTLQFSSATYSVNENAPTGVATITVNRVNGSDGTVSVDYATSDGSATASVDYTPAIGTLTLADGVTSASFDVPIIDDPYAEGNETVNLALSNVTGGATLGTPSTAVLTIVDEDPYPVVQFSSATYSVNEDGGSATISVTRTNNDFGEVSVNYATNGGSATAGSDYTAVSGTLTLVDGETSGTFEVPIIDDSLVEGDETVNLTLSDPVDAELGSQTTAVLTIVDNDVSITLAFSSSTYSVNENDPTGVATITVNRSGDLNGDVTVDYATSDGTATAGSDYTVSIGTLVMPSGASSASFDVPIIDDTVYEANETVNLTLSNPTGGATLGTPSSAVLTIVSDELTPTVQFSGATYSVDEFAGSATITVTRTGGSVGEVTVAYTSTDGTATAGSDYTAVSGTLTFADGETSATFEVPIVDDLVDEPNETVMLTLTLVSGDAVLGDPSVAVLTIVDDDLAPAGQLQFSSATYSVDEMAGMATITVTRTNGSAGEVTVDFTTSDGTATAGSDYTATSGTLTLADGVTSTTFDVPIIDDTDVEGNETVNLALSNPTGGASLGTPANAVLTIVDDDMEVPLAVLQFSGATYSVAENAGSVLITVTRTDNTTGVVSVDYATSDGSATAGSDYTATSGTLTLGDGVTSATFEVPIIDDADVEGSETVNLALSNPSEGATLGDQDTAVLTILDNDTPVGEGDAFLLNVNAPNSLSTNVGNGIDRIVRVYGDSTVVQETTVTLAVDAPAGVAVQFSPDSITAIAEPGRPATKYFFDARLDCVAAGTYEIVWTATISAAANDDPSNDVMQDVTTLVCNR